MDYDSILKKFPYSKLEKLNIDHIIDIAFKKEELLESISVENLLIILDNYLYMSFLQGENTESIHKFYSLIDKEELLLYKVGVLMSNVKYDFNLISNETSDLNLERKLIATLEVLNREEEFLSYYKFLNLDFQKKISDMKSVINLISDETLYNYIKGYEKSYMDIVKRKEDSFIKFLLRTAKDKRLLKKIIDLDITKQNKTEIFNQLSEEEKMKIILDKNSFVYDKYHDSFEKDILKNFSELKLPKDKLEEYFNTNNYYQQYLLGLIEIFIRQNSDIMNLVPIIDSSLNYSVCEKTMHIKKFGNQRSDSYKSFKEDFLSDYDFVFKLSFSKISNKKKRKLLKTKLNIDTNNFDDVLNMYKGKYEKMLVEGQIDGDVINSIALATKMKIDDKLFENRIDEIVEYLFDNKESFFNRFSINRIIEIYVNKISKEEDVYATVQVLSSYHHSFFAIGFSGDFSKGFYSHQTMFSEPLIAINSNYVNSNFVKCLDVFRTAFHELGHAYKNQISLKEEISFENLKILKEQNISIEDRKLKHKMYNYNNSYVEADADSYSFDMFTKFINKFEKDEKFKRNILEKSEVFIDETSKGKDYIIKNNKLYDSNYYFDLKNSEDDKRRLVSIYKTLLLEYDIDGKKIEASRLLNSMHYHEEALKDDKNNDMKMLIEDRLFIREASFENLEIVINLNDKLNDIVNITSKCNELVLNKYKKIILDSIINISDANEKYNLTQKMSERDFERYEENTKKLITLINKRYQINDVDDLNLKTLSDNIKNSKTLKKVYKKKNDFVYTID